MHGQQNIKMSMFSLPWRTRIRHSRQT